MNQAQALQRKFIENALWLAAGICVALWALHLYYGTLYLRGFFGDGAMAFLAHLSDSYVFGGDGHWVRLFSVGFPRDAQLLMDAFGMQVALWLDIRDPDTLKYIFNFWQFALPGFLYFALFFVLWRKGHASWIVFPLIAWAVLSPAIDWNAPNSTRWAMPVFWMHALLVILSGPQIKPAPAIAAVILGLAMLGGLYESVMMQASLCCGLGILFWFFRKNKAPLLYAALSVPGAIRAFYDYTQSGHSAPNKVDSLLLPHLVTHFWYFGLIGLALALIALFGSGKIPPRYVAMALFLLFIPGVNLLLDDIPNVWWQLGFRFDYVIYSLALMAWAGYLRLRGVERISFAPSVALIALTAGSFLWASQIDGTLHWWAPCRVARAEQTQGQTLDIDPAYSALFVPSPAMTVLPPLVCVWDWAEPWTQMLLTPGGKITHWSILTFWQDFTFVKKDGGIFLHTNNWTLNSPAMQESREDLPLKTLLYDLTPLYDKLGPGPLAKRRSCYPAAAADEYWRASLLKMDDATRAKMFVCPHESRAR